MELKIGDIVRLKSGGPEMTVDSYPAIPVLLSSKVDPNYVRCIWFDKATKQIDVFHIDTIEKVQ